uniref:Uncharacterized protein n=1 Tax=Arundo donax TaxID=35708 RepID=A0A0A9AI07_ARUDO
MLLLLGSGGGGARGGELPGELLDAAVVGARELDGVHLGLAELHAQPLLGLLGGLRAPPRRVQLRSQRRHLLLQLGVPPPQELRLLCPRAGDDAPLLRAAGSGHGDADGDRRRHRARSRPTDTTKELHEMEFGRIEFE